MTKQFITSAMLTAIAAAGNSLSTRTKVGCAIYKEGKLISTGFNRMANANEALEINGVSKPNVLHAELIAIMDAKVDADGADVFCTMSPCPHCAQVFIYSGVRSVTFLHNYRISDGVTDMRECGIDVKWYNGGVFTDALDINLETV